MRFRNPKKQSELVTQKNFRGRGKEEVDWKKYRSEKRGETWPIGSSSLFMFSAARDLPRDALLWRLVPRGTRLGESQTVWRVNTRESHSLSLSLSAFSVFSHPFQERRLISSPFLTFLLIAFEKRTKKPPSLFFPAAAFFPIMKSCRRLRRRRRST